MGSQTMTTKTLSDYVPAIRLDVAISPMQAQQLLRLVKATERACIDHLEGLHPQICAMYNVCAQIGATLENAGVTE